MREIKFRAWDNLYNEWYPKKVQLVVRMSGKVTDGSTTPDVTLEQYIGLKDKNGKEIYEGDVVKCHGLSSITIVVVEDIRNVPVQVLAWPTAYGENRGSIEIVGNIHENPELMEEPHD